MMGDKILLDRKNGVAVITLNNPDVMNALDMAMREDLKKAFADVAKDPEIGAVILAGAGKNFCSGGDINTMGNSKANDGRKRQKNVQIFIRSIMDMEKPVIAAVQGFAAGGGMNIALACDLIIAADNARFCESFTKVGLPVADCGSYTLPRRVGMAKAKELVLLAPVIDAQAALEMGLINKVVPPEQLMPEVMAIAAKLADGPRIALGMSKILLNKSFDTDADKLLEFEAFAMDVCMQTRDFAEGIAAFREKRKPIFNAKV